MCLAVEYQLAVKIEGIQGTCQLDISVAIAIDMVDKRRGKGLGKVKTGTFSLDVQVDIVAFGRHITVDEGFCCRTVIGNSLYVNLFCFFVPGDICVQITHSSVLKLEVSDEEFRIGFQFAEDTSQRATACCLTAETDRIEVNQIKDIFDINIAHIDVNGVLAVF